MSEERSAEQVEQHYISGMGSRLGRLFFCLYNECVWLNWTWSEFVTLFGSKPERVDLLNSTAPLFFRIIQDCLWESILLGIARFTDPPSARGKNRQHLTLRQLPSLLDGDLRVQIGDLLAKCLGECEFARDWRDRHIAHRNLQLALDDPVAPLAFASRQTAGSAIHSISALLNALELHYLGSTVAYEPSAPKSAESLLLVVQDGLRAEARRRDRLRSGKYEPEE
ncbi:MAG: hypothetical protein ACHP78_15505 [Terriglobales bacterium]